MSFNPKQLHYSTEGIPILSAQQIEDYATGVIQKHCPNVLRKLAPTPVMTCSLIRSDGIKYRPWQWMWQSNVTIGEWAWEVCEWLQKQFKE